MNIDRIETQILNDHPDFSGVVSLSENNIILYEEAFGLAVINEAISNKIHTKFPMASGSKIFTAAAVMKLVEMGSINLEDPVVYYLPDHFLHMDEKVTIKDLLTHTSGFQDYFDEEENDDFSGIWKDIPMYAMRKPKDFLVLLRDKKMEFSPGERFKYNNGGFVILSMLIEEVSEMEFKDFVSKHVFEAAGMEDTGYFAMNALPKDTAIGYLSDDEGNLISNIYSLPIIGGGDGGAYTTVHNMNLFWNALLKGDLFNEDLVKEMITAKVNTGEEDYSYGLGVWIRTKDEAIDMLYVVGSDPGVSLTSQYSFKDNQILTVLSNRDDQAFDARRSVMTQMSS